MVVKKISYSGSWFYYLVYANLLLGGMLDSNLLHGIRMIYNLKLTNAEINFVQNNDDLQ